MKSDLKIKVGVVVIAVFAIAVFYFTNKLYSNSEVNRAGEYVIKYLNLKYNRDFVIKNGRYIFNTGGYEFNVYPKDDPDFTFHAWLNGMTSSGISEMYLIMQEKNEGKKMVKPYIDKISKDYFISAISVSPYTPLPDIDLLLSDMYDNQRTISYMLKKYPKKMRIAITCHINENITLQNKNDVLKKVYNLLEFLKRKKFGYIEMWLLFYDFQDKSISELGHKEGVNMNMHYAYKAKYWINIIPRDLKNIHTYKGLESCLKLKTRKGNK